MRNRVCAGALAGALICSASLGAGGSACAQSINQVVRSDIRLSADHVVVETIHQETTALVESAVRTAAQFKWTIGGNQTVEIIEAFTRKADGRKIRADASDFVTQAGAVGAAMSFVDLKVQQIPFRDLSVGDTAVVTLRVTQKRHYIPNNYSRSFVLRPGPIRRTIDVTLRAPATLDVHHDEQILRFEESRQGDEIVRHWSGTAAPAPVEQNAADVAFLVPALRISTFVNFESIATAYYDEAKKKAVVTPEIQRLADEITKDKVGARDQARALYEWVTRNIRYVAVYFGSGRFVPNDTATILSRRFGDCKDDATLLSALLAAKGIPSEQVLLGTKPAYRLPATATVSAFNHVIVYIPSLDLYVDPTVPFGNFNHLPSSDRGKPVVRISDKGAMVARTPGSSVEDNVIELDSRMATLRDGRRQGETVIVARGDFAGVMRAYAAQIEARGKDVVLQPLAQQRGLLSGTYDFDAPAWTDRQDSYRVTMKWTLPKPGPGDKSFRLPPGFSPVLPHPAFFFGDLAATKRVYPTVCRAGRIVHNVHVALPAEVVSVKLPPAIKRSTPQLTYRDEWMHEGQQLRRRTEVVSSVSEGACAPAQIDAIVAMIRKIGPAHTPMVAYRRGGAATAAAHPGLMQRLFGTPTASDHARPPAPAHPAVQISR
jgi:transglutaminase-like putative cysteine protease